MRASVEEQLTITDDGNACIAGANAGQGAAGDRFETDPVLPPDLA